ncbi:hypothetical protein AKG43_02910 [Neisseria sp. 74A18]|nr:hypothetical protein AKG43_02910 [Neisseria sp. 74A18]
MTTVLPGPSRAESSGCSQPQNTSFCLGCKTHDSDSVFKTFSGLCFYSARTALYCKAHPSGNGRKITRFNTVSDHCAHWSATKNSTAVPKSNMPQNIFIIDFQTERYISDGL